MVRLTMPSGPLIGTMQVYGTWSDIRPLVKVLENAGYKCRWHEDPEAEKQDDPTSAGYLSVMKVNVQEATVVNADA